MRLSKQRSNGSRQEQSGEPRVTHGEQLFYAEYFSKECEVEKDVEREHSISGWNSLDVKCPLISFIAAGNCTQLKMENHLMCSPLI